LSKNPKRGQDPNLWIVLTESQQPTICRLVIETDTYLQF